MGRLGETEQAALASVARRCSATWEAADADAPDAWLTLAGKRIAVEVTALQPSFADRTRPRLRFDRVALGLVRRLRAALADAVPAGEAVVLTVTAPIRLPAKTAAALEARVRDGLAGRPARLEIKAGIGGNQVQARLVKGVSARASKVIGFVHNPGPDPDLLLDLTQSMLQAIGAAADKPPPEAFTGERWLVVASQDGPDHVETYRQVYAALGIATDFKQVLMALAGRVESLA